MKTVSRIVVLAVVTGLSWPAMTDARLSSNNRRAVVLEAFFALRPSHDGGCNRTINGNCVSNWNYLAFDPAAYFSLRDAYRCNSSVWKKTPADGCGGPATPASFYANVNFYGYGTFGGRFGNVGRGGQCRYFANLVLRRSGSYLGTLPSYQSMWSSTQSDLKRAVPGDVLTTDPTYAQPHTAIVVEVKKDVRGNVTGLDVIDSNWLSDTGLPNREVIGRHVVTVPNTHFRIWTGAPYYYQAYVPTP